ncbi:SRPBCC family protein [Nannocystaceae bacterium ST9]
MLPIRAEIEIAAPAERVWPILCDLERYAEWNPFTRKVESDRVVGHPIVLHVDFGTGKLLRQVEIIRRFEPGVELRWGTTMGPAWWFRAERWQRVEPIDDRRCRYVTEDPFEGVFAPVVAALYADKVRRGFEAVARALARRAEAIEAHSPTAA